MEEHFSALSGLPEPLMVAAREREPDNPLTLPCDDLIVTTEKHVGRSTCGPCTAVSKGHTLSLATIPTARISDTRAPGEESFGRLRGLTKSGNREQDNAE